MHTGFAKSVEVGGRPLPRPAVESHPRVSSGADMDASDLSLSDAQLVLARECGFTSWPQMKNHLDLGRTIRDPRDYAMFSWR